MKDSRISRRITGKFFLSVVIFICTIVFLDKCLNLSSYIYKKTFLSKRHSGIIEGEKNKFIFIGDSWVEGGEAPFGRGFPEQFIKELKDKDPSVDCSYTKACWSASNSSQAVLQLVDALINYDFEWAFVLTGANNAWNTEAVDKVDDFAYELYGWPPLHKNVPVNFLTRLGLPRLGRIVSLYNFDKYMRYTKETTYRYPWHIIGKISDDLGAKDVSMDQVREFLVRNPERAKDYNQFFMAIKLTFGNQYDVTEEFLRSNNLWKPELIKNLEREHMTDGLMRWEVAERDLRLIARLCGEDNIKLIFLTYPSPWPSFDTINNVVRKVASKENVILVDEDKMFKQELKSISDWKLHFAKHHPNEKGYALMAKNLNLLFTD